MHGQFPGFAIVVNTEVDFMGGIIDFGVGTDTRSSPRHVAIAKAQEELRMEFDVREERRRELEFLEKGGNPLDFKFGRTASLSVQSTSFTNPLVENEAKGSLALAASPHGDSVESSGQPGGSVDREPNTADNLLLLDGDNSIPGGEKYMKRTGRRGNVALLEHSSRTDGCNTRLLDDSVIFGLGAKGQAYARRNRSRSSRDSHVNKSPILPLSSAYVKDAKESHGGLHAEEHAVSFISNSKPASSNAKTATKTFASEDQVELEIAGEQAPHVSLSTSKDELQGAPVRIHEKLLDFDHAAPVKRSTANNIAEPLIERDDSTTVSYLSVLPQVTEDSRSIIHDIFNGYSASDNVIHMSKDNVDGKNIVSRTAGNVQIINTNRDDHHVSTGCNQSYIVIDDYLQSRAGGNLAVQSREQGACQGPSDYSSAREKSKLAASASDVPSIHTSRSSQTNASDSKDQFKAESMICNKVDEHGEERPLLNTESVENKSPENPLGDDSLATNKSGVGTNSTPGSIHEPSATIYQKNASTTPEIVKGEASQLKFVKKVHEDAILKEARLIEANLKRAGVLPFSSRSLERQKKCHWDFVLEEMAWMANDFMQENLWKRTAAAQVSHFIASNGRSKFLQENLCRKQRNVARTLAKAVMQFWHSANVFSSGNEASTNNKKDFVMEMCKSTNIGSVDITEDQCLQNLPKDKYITEIYRDFSQQGILKGILQQGIHGYAIRLLQYMANVSNDPLLPEAPCTPDRINDACILKISCGDQLSEECLFYEVPPGAVHCYRELVEFHSNHKKMDSCAHRLEYQASLCDSIADGSRDSAFEEDEGETGTDILLGESRGNFSFKVSNKKMKKVQQKSYNQRLREVGTDLSYEPSVDWKFANQSVLISGKRPSPSTVNVGAVPTKRLRTAPRQRMTCPYSTGVPGALQITSKTDVSSGDTCSLQDDQSSLHSGSQPRKNMEVESTVDFERQLPFDGSEISSKSKKIKKPKHFGYKHSLNLADSSLLIIPGNASLYEQGMQVDSMVHHDQRDQMKRRLDNQQFESNGNAGFYGQHVSKKPKLVKHTDFHEPAGGSIRSPAASQMSNMSNSNKLIRIINSRDRGRKHKAMKMAAGQAGSGTTWSMFEDQALVVLVHDMGLNWELVSDALNSTLHFKALTYLHSFKLQCIYRKPKECKERHKSLMDRSASDGADSAEDSGSSQPYPSTLPGIPKGSARQLFQRLQGPMEEDTLKAHFEKIILIGQRLHSSRTQNGSQELKQIIPAHSSHVFALSQACPNNLSGPILSPLDFCDTVNSSSDSPSIGYPGSHANGIAVAGQPGSLASPLPTSTGNVILQGSSTITHGNGLSLPSPSANTPPRDPQRYIVPRSTTILVDDQQRLQQYNQMYSGRNMQQSGVSVPAPSPSRVDRGVRMLHGGSGMGIMCGANRSMPITRPGFQGISSSGMLNMASSTNMLSSNGVGLPNPVSVQSGVVSVPGNTVLRPRDSLQIPRPGQSTEEHRPIMIQELPMQVSQVNAPAVTTFNNMSAPFSNAIVPPVQTFPVQHQSHQISHMHGNPHHPHIQGTNHASTQQQAYIRFTKERQLQQQMMPQSQHSYSNSTPTSSMQNNSQLQLQNQSSPIASLSPSPSQLKQQNTPRNPPQSGGAVSPQIMKQRQRQQVEQQHQQPRNVPQAQQPKIMKSLGRGSMLMHQNLPDASNVGGVPAASKSQMQLNQGSFFSGSTGLKPNLPQPTSQQKLYSSRLHTQSLKQSPAVPSHQDNNQTSLQVTPSISLIPSQPSLPSNMQRIAIQHNRQSKADGRMQSTQMTPPTSVPDSVSSTAVFSSGAQSSFEASTLSQTVGIGSSPQENLTGCEQLVQRQLSGNINIHGHDAGGQWQHTKQSPLPSQQQQKQLLHSKQSPSPPQPQQQHKHGLQGSLYAKSSNAGLG
ncbi:E1A-binding protein p400 [Apostasia shenzhenica]|uniref:E1A-binding protein p400 n=1 Tax=Apostasia shenzhenica TaxID=1088818 RepID=A0A2I0B6C6_9ASPA|nr:E1A-binding protein p400 [Apostasia shenzhenica]